MRAHSTGAEVHVFLRRGLMIAALLFEHFLVVVLA